MSLITVQDIIETGRQASLTNTVLAEWAEKGTPKQALLTLPWVKTGRGAPVYGRRG
jgi:hypothetical protein